jgi:predicted outer membrane repeat protein
MCHVSCVRGGGVFVTGASLFSARDAFISENLAATSGGGIEAKDGDTVTAFRAVRLSHNEAPLGAALLLVAPSLIQTAELKISHKCYPGARPSVLVYDVLGTEEYPEKQFVRGLTIEFDGCGVEDADLSSAVVMPPATARCNDLDEIDLITQTLKAVCAVNTDCRDAPMFDGAFFFSATCACRPPAIPNTDLGEAAPYIAGGCVTRFNASTLHVAIEKTLQLSLFKTSTSAESEEVGLAFEIFGDDWGHVPAEMPRWQMRSALPNWVVAEVTEGAVTEENQDNLVLPLIISSDELAETSDGQPHLVNLARAPTLACSSSSSVSLSLSRTAHPPGQSSPDT